MSSFGLKPEPKPMPAINVEGIAAIKPHSQARPARNLDEIDLAGQGAGFVSREAKSDPVKPYIRPSRKRDRPVEQLYQLSMRPPVSVVERFYAYAEKHHLSLPRALEQLLDESERLPS
jgi:hypothetical protein